MPGGRSTSNSSARSKARLVARRRAGDEEHGEARGHRAALERAQAVAARLVRPEARLIQLFNPPFDHGELNPGYIKGYVPGVRENGGQYSHAAIWTVMAFAELGELDRAWDLCAYLNPVHHATTAAAAARYKVEPYVMPADIYAVPPHTGRGGWTWYTGSAGWMYRLLVETLLGVRLEGDALRLQPRLPTSWESLTIHYRYRETFYHIHVQAQKSPAASSWMVKRGTTTAFRSATTAVTTTFTSSWGHISNRDNCRFR